MKKSARGFTLIELLTAIVVIAILSTAGFFYIDSFRENQKLISASSDLQSILRQGQASAGARNKCTTSDGEGYGATWWVEFGTDRKSVSLICDNDLTTSASQTIKIYTLATGVQIDSVTGDNCSPSIPPSNPVKVNFSPLNANISFQDSETACDFNNNQYLIITLKNTKTQGAKSVKVDKGGSISVQ